MRIKKKSALWTKNFTIITMGSVVSMLGGAMLAFAMPSQKPELHSK